MSDIAEKKVCVFKLPEHFTVSVPRSVVAELQDLPNGDNDCVTLDMSDTATIDSTGIGVLVYLYKELMARSKSFVLRKPQRNVYNLLIETGIDRLFDVELSFGVKKAEAARLDSLDPQISIDEEMVGNVCVISIRGVMNYPAGSSQFRKNMFLTLASSNKVLLDFSELAFFDSLSVGSVLRVSRLLAESGGSMRICCANRVVRNVFESLGVDALVPFYDTREAALDKW